MDASKSVNLLTYFLFTKNYATALTFSPAIVDRSSLVSPAISIFIIEIFKFYVQ